MKILAKLKHSGSAVSGIKIVARPQTKRPQSESPGTKQPKTIFTTGNPTPDVITFMSSRYKLVQPLGRGGMGIIYKAHDKTLDMFVTIKFLPPRLVRDQAAIAQFKREAGIAMQLSHEHIIKLYNLIAENNRMFLVMEYIEGRNFRTILSETGRLAASSCSQIAKSCALALDYAHERNVLHLDLKPDNLMLTDDRILKIIDFGTARRIEAESADNGENMVEGTPSYMSPEQIMGEPLDNRTDVYSLGAVIYELICGRPAYPFDTPVETILRQAPAHLSPHIPEAFAKVIEKALARNREDRWSSAGEFAGHLEAALDR